jgi:hypothetical protein
MAVLTAIIREICLQGWPLAYVWELEFQEGSQQTSDKNGSFCIHANNMFYTEH